MLFTRRNPILTAFAACLVTSCTTISPTAHAIRPAQLKKFASSDLGEALCDGNNDASKSVTGTNAGGTNAGGDDTSPAKCSNSYGAGTRAIIASGYIYSELKCDQFFDRLQQHRNENAFLAQDLVALSSAGTAVASFTKSNARVAGMITAMLTLGQAVTENYGTYILLNKYNTQIYGLVKKTQDQYKTDVANSLNINGHPTDDNYKVISRDEAYLIVLRYAEICSLPSIDDLASTAISAAQVQPTAPTPPSTDNASTNNATTASAATANATTANAATANAATARLRTH